MKFSKRASLFAAMRDKELSSEVLDAYIAPVGVLCSVMVTEEGTSLLNGRTTFNNDPLSDYLVKCGVTGTFILHHKSMMYGVARWISYQLHHTPFDEWCNDIIIYTFDDIKSKGGRVAISPIERVALSYDGLPRELDTYSQDDSFDGFIIRGVLKSGIVNWYHVLPTRYCQGRVIGYRNEPTDKFIIVEVQYNDQMYFTKVRKFTQTMLRMLDEYQGKIVSRRVKVQFSSYLPGDRIDNFSSATALFVINQYVKS